MNPERAVRKIARASTPIGRIRPCMVALACALLCGSGGVRAGEVPIGERLRGVQTLAPLVKEVAQSVVGIRASSESVKGYPSVEGNPGFPDESGAPAKDVYGAGVVIQAELGLIVTSHHVVKDAKAVAIRLPDGRELDAHVAVVDERFDLAILRIPSSGLTAGRLGRSVDVQPGDFVLAVGAPFGLGQSVSFGIVSAVHRSWPGLCCHDLIQTDVLLDRGNSGGPLLNLRGEIIGIVTARAGETATERSFGFAIPSDAIDRLLARLQSRRTEFGLINVDIHVTAVDSDQLVGAAAALEILP